MKGSVEPFVYAIFDRIISSPPLECTIAYRLYSAEEIGKAIV